MILLDSIHASNIPKDALAIAGYVDGNYAWSQADFDSFTMARIKRHITVGYYSGDTLDVENFNAQPSFAGPWCINRLNAGIIDPWVYSDRNEQHACENSMQAAGVPIDRARMWVATLDGTVAVARYIYPVAAVQVQDVGPYDISHLTGEDEMPRLVTGDSGNADPHGKGAVYVCDGLWKRYINDPGALPGYEAFLGPVQTVAQGMLNEIPEQVPTAAVGVPTKLEGTFTGEIH